MASRVVRPDDKRIEISRGDWILVKKRLNHGERTAAFARKYTTDIHGSRVDLERLGLAFVTSYLLDWSLTGLDDKPLVIRGVPIEVVDAMLNVIDDESFAEIEAAILAHEKAMVAERLAEKNAQDGTIESAAILPSLDGADGGTSGSPI